MRSHFDFQVASSDSFQLPTLKQLISHSTFNNEEENVRVTQSSLPSSYLSLNENSIRKSFVKQKVVDIPKQILDDRNDDPDKLLLLGVPQDKLNRTILHTVQKIKVFDPESLEKDDNLGIGGFSNTNLLTNEFLVKQKRPLNEVKEISSEKTLQLERSASTYRGRSNRRRTRVNPILSTSTDDSIASQSTSVQTIEQISSKDTVGKLSTKENSVQTAENTSQNILLAQTTESSLPLNPRAADIERARKRRIRIKSSQVTAAPIHNNQNTYVRGRSSRRRNRVNLPESTTVSITTSRGTTLPSTITTDFPRGFLLTRNIDDILAKGVDKLTTVSIQSIDSSTVPTTEKTLTYSTKSFTDLPTTTEYSQSGTITSFPLVEDTNQEEESNFFDTTTRIPLKNEYNQPIETTTKIFETTIPKINNDEIDMNTSTSEEISSTEASTLPHYYVRKKIRKIKPVSFPDLETFKSSIEDRNIPTTESSFTNPDSTFTTFDSTFYTTSYSATSATFDTTSSTITLSTTPDPTSESTLFTTEASSKEQSTISENLTESEVTTEHTLLRNEDLIKPNSNYVDLNTEKPDFLTTKFYVQEQTNSYDDFEKLNLEIKDAEIRDSNITAENDSAITPMSIDQNETATFLGNSLNTSIANEIILLKTNDTSSLPKTNDQISTELPPKISNRPTNGRRRVLKKKRQRIDPIVEEKSMEVAKTETIEVTLQKKENSTSPATINSSSKSEIPSRKRVVVYRGNRKFTSRTTPSTVQSSPDTGEHPNQIASRRRTKKVVRKRPKLSSVDTPESDLSTLDDESIREGKQLSLDPETKSLDDADQAGSEVNEKSVNLQRSLPSTSRRLGSVFHREPNRIRSRASTYQPLTTTQPTLKRFSSPSAGRQSLYFEETTLPSKIRSASVNDAAILLERLGKVEDQRAENDDQTNRAQELVMLEDSETTPRTTEPGYSSLKKAFWRKISTTETPKTLATTAIPAFRRQQGQKYYNGVISQNLPQRPRRPAIVDYDYYEDEEVRFVGKPRLNGKLYVTSRGSINCLDQGNFPHPTSCRKFITCARMVNGLVVGTEYTCPEKLSFDPIGGICNWSAGLGCKE